MHKNFSKNTGRSKIGERHFSTPDIFNKHLSIASIKMQKKRKTFFSHLEKMNI